MTDRSARSACCLLALCRSPAPKTGRRLSQATPPPLWDSSMLTSTVPPTVFDSTTPPPAGSAGDLSSNDTVSPFGLDPMVFVSWLPSNTSELCAMTWAEEVPESFWEVRLPFHPRAFFWLAY